MHPGPVVLQLQASEGRLCLQQGLLDLGFGPSKESQGECCVPAPLKVQRRFPLLNLDCPGQYFGYGLTCVFWFTLIQNEIVETYTWVLEMFLECMKGMLLETVLTDGCRSMNKTLEDLIPNVVHRTC